MWTSWNEFKPWYKHMFKLHGRIFLSQRVPLKPGKHLHCETCGNCGWIVQLPIFWHGLISQGFVEILQ